MNFDRKYLVWALAYIATGMGLGVFMAASHNHAQHITHAHINLVGFLLSLSYGIIHKLWLGDANPLMANIQLIVHQAGALTMFTGLFLLYGGYVPEPKLEPILAISSIAVWAGGLLMLYMALKANYAKI